MHLIGKQGHKASSYEQRSLIKLSWAHTPFLFCRAQVHISQLLRVFITLVCLHALKQIDLKLHVLRQSVMKNENKNTPFTYNVFYRNGLSCHRHLLGIKGILTLPCVIIMLQIQHTEFLLTTISVLNNETC